MVESELIFRGNDAAECTAFIREVQKRAHGEGRFRDFSWMADLAALAFDGSALIWFDQQSLDTQADWILLRRALLEHYCESRLPSTLSSVITTSLPPPCDYTIKNVSSKKVLDLEGGRTELGTPIINYSFHGDMNQTWTFEPGYQGYKIKNGSGTYIGFPSGGRIATGTAISGNPVGAEWRIQRHGNNYLIELASDPSLVLELFESNGNDGTKIIAQPKTCNPNQDWILEPKIEPVKASYTGPFPTGFPFRIRNVHSQKVLDLLHDSPAPGTQIVSWAVNGGKHQSWILEAGEHGYRIKSASHTNRYLSFAQGVSPTTQNSSISGNPTPIEWIIALQNNLVFVHLANDPNLVLDLSDYHTENGARIIVWPKHGGKNQGWIFEATA